MISNNKTYTLDNSEYLSKNPDWHISDSPWKALQIQKIIDHNQLKFENIAEIGCGAGEILNQLTLIYKNRPINYFGYEISPDAHKLCLERSKINLAFFQEDLLSNNKFYDILLIMDVIEHVDDYLGFIKKCGSKAVYKIYHIPLDISALGIIRDVPLAAKKSVNHIHYFMKDTALSSLTDSGQEIIDYFYTPVMIEVHNKKISTKILNIFRKILYKINPDFCVKFLGGYSILVLTK